MRLIVDVTRADPLTGSVRTAEGEAHEFTTWLGLMAALRATVGEEPAARRDHTDAEERA